VKHFWTLLDNKHHLMESIELSQAERLITLTVTLMVPEQYSLHTLTRNLQENKALK